MRFACYQLAYGGLKQDFRNASISLFNNNWSDIHDFTPVPESGGNWSLLPESIKVTDFFDLNYFQPEQHTEESEMGNGDAKTRSSMPNQTHFVVHCQFILIQGVSKVSIHLQFWFASQVLIKGYSFLQKT